MFTKTDIGIQRISELGGWYAVRGAIDTEENGAWASPFPLGYGRGEGALKNFCTFLVLKWHVWVHSDTTIFKKS